MPWELGAARSWSLLTYLLWESFYCHFDLCMTCVYVISLLVHAPLFLGDADMLITRCLVMAISGPYLLFFQYKFIIYFGVWRPDLWESRTVIYSVHVSLLFLFMLWLLDICGRSFGWCDLYWYLYVLIGGWDWPGVGIGVPIRIDCLISSIRRPVPIFGPGGLLSVK